MSQRNKANNPSRRAAVELTQLETDPSRFQHRTVELDNAHVEALASVARNGDALDRIAVWEEDGKLVVVDGHHREAAYHRAGWSKKVPVTIHSGTEEDAQFLTMSDNGKHRLQMTQDEKSNWAWNMVVEYPDLTSRRIAEGPVSLRQVKNMRAVKKRLEKAGKDLPQTWGVAMMLDKGELGEWDEAQREEARRRRKAKLLEAIRAPLARTAEHDPQLALEVVETIMGKSRFEDAADWMGYRKMTEAEIEGEWLNSPF